MCIKRRVRWNYESIVEHFTRIHNGKYDYSKFKYTRMQDKSIIICPSHGEFTQNTNSHFRGKGCRKCSNEITSKRKVGTVHSFVRLSKKLHGSFYNYDKAVYVNAHTKLVITCPVHGDFTMTPSNHVNTTKPQGCSKCANRVGWTRDSWVKACLGKFAKLYIVKCYFEDELFFKIGITLKNSISDRFYSNTMPYHYDLVRWVESEDSGAIYDLERTLHRLHKEFKYTPKKPFEGSSECFNKIII